MFDKTPAQTPETSAAPAVATGKSDIVIRTMPREFYGKEAALLEGAKPEVKPVPSPVTPVAPAVVAAPVQKPLPPGPIKKRSKAGIVITIFVALLIIAGIAYGAYQLIQSANEAAAEAQQQAQDAADALAAQKAAEEAAAAKAAAEAAKAAATPVPGKDTDSDGLTDVEELLYGTNFRDPDSDEDTFLDGNEVFHRYHPLGTAPATLLDTGAVKVFTDAAYPYTLYYPSTWTVALTRDTFGVTFQSARQASISVEWEEKDPSETLDDLLTDVVTTAERSEMKEVMTKEGYFGLMSADDRTAYLDMGTAMATMVYDLGGKTQIEYLQTFQMMANSFALMVVDAVTPTP